MKRSQKFPFLQILLVVSLVFGLFVVSSSASYADDRYAFPMYYNNTPLAQNGFFLRGNVYVPISVLQSYGDTDKITFNTSKMQASFNLAELNMQMADTATTEFVQKWGGTVYVPLKKVDNVVVISLNAVEQLCKLSGAYDASRSRILLFPYAGGSASAAVTSREVTLTPSLGAYSTAPVTLPEGETLYITGETPSYYKAQTASGITGYVQKSAIKIMEIDLSDLDFYAPKKTKDIDSGVPINLAWEYASASTPVAPAVKHPGLDVLAPTWLDLFVEQGGAVQNETDAGYVDLAHANGYKVWTTITNNFSATGSTNFTSKCLADEAMMNKAIAQYLFYTCFYDCDGINIDFEQMKDAITKDFTNFVASLRNYTERQGLVLSVDTMLPRPWNVEYDFTNLAKHVDYLIIMSYDEHYSSSTSAGSVSSLPWVEEAVQDTLAMVPNEKLIMGIPFYTRVWVTDNNNRNLSNSSASMAKVQELIKTNNLTPTWSASGKQYFVSWPAANGRTNKIWIEDSRSIANRLALVQKYDLAGSACWQLAFADDTVWPVFEAMLKNGAPLSQFDTEKY